MPSQMPWHKQPCRKPFLTGLKASAGGLLWLLFALALPFAPASALANDVRFGTGFSVDAQGYVVTALHVIKNAEKIQVFIPGQKAALVARVVKVNAVSDLALLKVQVSHALKPLVIGTFIETPVGLDVFALGHPRPSIQGRALKITAGLLTSDDGFRGAPNQFQFSAAINVGQSGGPIMSADGKVIGVAIGRLRSDADSGTQEIPTNVGFALKSEALLRFLHGTATEIIAGPFDPSEKNSAVDIFKLASPSIVLVEARLASGKEGGKPRDDSGQSQGSEAAKPGSVTQYSKRHVQALVNQGFRDPARTSIGFLMVRATGLKIPIHAGIHAVEAELMTSMDNAKLDRQQRQYQSSLTRLGFNCSSDNMSILGRSLYSGPFLSGGVIDRQLPQKQEWLEVPSPALKNYLRGSLC